MTIIWVWVLVAVSYSAHNHGTVTFMDNIATAESCEVLRQNVEYRGTAWARCVRIQKVRS